MTLVDVGAIEEFPSGRARVVSVEDKEVGVVSWHGEFFALRNICPHLGAPLCSGSLYPLLTQPSVLDADLTVSQDTPMVMCPWHHWEFDLRSGACVTGKQRVKTYPVLIENGRVQIDLETTQTPTPTPAT